MNEITVVPAHKSLWRNKIHKMYRTLKPNILTSGSRNDRIHKFLPIPPATYS